MHEKNLKHKTEKENKTKRSEMEDKSNQNAASHTQLTLNQLIRNAKNSIKK